MSCLGPIAVSLGAIISVVSVSNAQKIYWSGGDTIARANLDGTGIETIITVPSAGSCDFDEVDRKIYWLDALSLKIQRANEDGTNIEDLVTTGLSVPRGLDVDEVGRKL